MRPMAMSAAVAAARISAGVTAGCLLRCRPGWPPPVGTEGWRPCFRGTVVVVGGWWRRGTVVVVGLGSVVVVVPRGTVVVVVERGSVVDVDGEVVDVVEVVDAAAIVDAGGPSRPRATEPTAVAPAINPSADGLRHGRPGRGGRVTTPLLLGGPTESLTFRRSRCGFCRHGAGRARRYSSCRPHSALSRPAQRPDRGSLPGATGRVQGAHPTDGYPRSSSGLYGTSWSATYPATSRSDQVASGLILTRPRRSRATTGASTRVEASTRRRPLIQACLPARARSSCSTLAAEQHCSGSSSHSGTGWGGTVMTLRLRP